MTYHLDPSTQGKCITMATNLSPDLEQRTVLVMLPFCVMCLLMMFHVRNTEMLVGMSVEDAVVTAAVLFIVSRAFCHLFRHLCVMWMM